MNQARLLNRPEDYQRLGINPDTVELWEDGRRDTAAVNHFEWWYFDAIARDGTTVVVQFLNKAGRKIMQSHDSPTVFLKLTLPDGTKFDKSVTYKTKDAVFSREQCDIKIDRHRVRGDLKKYSIHVDLIDDVGVDMELENIAAPYRPGTSYIEFGSSDRYYTWLCIAPRCRVTGTLRVHGEVRAFDGYGYHDHQWGSVNIHKEWNHWVWARQNFEDYSLLLFDMIANDANGNTRFPLVFIQDKNGALVFENTHGAACEVLDEYRDEIASGKTYPKKLHYTFENNGKKLDYTLAEKTIIETKGSKNVPLPMKLALKIMGIDPSYTRYLASGDMELSDENGELRRSGELIYEFMFPGQEYKELITR